MKKIGFIGAFDKTDFLIYLAKVLTVLNNRVLIIDSSLMQKAKYVVPSIQPTKSYITEFEKIDIAVGFTSMDQLTGYLGMMPGQELEYDIILLDIDSIESLNDFNTKENQVNFFATAFDAYSLKKGLEILSALSDKIPLTEKIYVLLVESDREYIIENQMVNKIKFKNLGNGYKDGISQVVTTILPNIRQNDILKAYKSIDKGV